MDINPNDSQIHLALGKLYYKLENYPKATYFLNRVYVKDRKNEVVSILHLFFNVDKEVQITEDIKKLTKNIIFEGNLKERIVEENYKYTALEIVKHVNK